MRVLYTMVRPAPVYPDGTAQPSLFFAWPQAQASVARYAPQAEHVVIDPLNWWEYWDAVEQEWGYEDLMLVEQDIILHGRAVPELEACPEPWCLFPYYHPGSDGLLGRGLGCTRFSLAFQLSVTMDDVAAVPGCCPRCDGSPERYKCWAHLDGRIAQAAEDRGFTPHVHSPAVGHRDVPPEGES